MTQRTADAVVGMMDAAYFIGRKELLEFFNNLLDLNLTKIEQTASGAVACQITDLMFPGSIPLSKIDWGARSDYEYVQNYKLLQNAFNKHRVQRHVDVDKLIRAKYQDNLEFCQWLKAFYDQSGTIRENYDPSAVRLKGKGGKQYNMTMGRNSSGRSSGMSGASRAGMGARTTAPRVGSTSTTTQRPTSSSMTSASKAVTSTNTTAAAPVRDSSRPLRDIQSSSSHNNINKSGNSSSTSAAAVADAALIQKNAELTNKNDELELAVLEIERERDFYFEKLRNVEVMLQIYQEKGNNAAEPNHLIDNIFKILYATAEENYSVNEEGDAIPCNSIEDSRVVVNDPSTNDDDFFHDNDDDCLLNDEDNLLDTNESIVHNEFEDCIQP